MRPEMRRHGASRRSSRPKKVRPSAVPPQGLHLGRTGHIPRDCVGSAPDKPTRTWAPSVRPEMRRHGASRRSSRPKKVRPSAVPPQGLHLGRTGHIPRDCVGSAPDKPTRTWAPSVRPEMRRHGASRRSSRPKKVRPSAVPPQGLHLGRTGHIPRDRIVPADLPVSLLGAIAARISEFGFSPNKVAALGENLILLVNLGWSAVL